MRRLTDFDELMTVRAELGFRETMQIYEPECPSITDL